MLGHHHNCLVAYGTHVFNNPLCIQCINRLGHICMSRESLPLLFQLGGCRIPHFWKHFIAPSNHNTKLTYVAQSFNNLDLLPDVFHQFSYYVTLLSTIVMFYCQLHLKGSGHLLYSACRNVFSRAPVRISKFHLSFFPKVVWLCANLFVAGSSQRTKCHTRCQVHAVG